MQTKFIALMGATGNTGKEITEVLFKEGEKVRVLGVCRSLLKLDRLRAET